MVFRGRYDGATMKSIPEALRDARLQHGWRYGHLARLCGASTPREISKLSQRLFRLENEERVHERRLAFRVATVLDVDVVRVRRLIEEQRMEEQLAYEAWLDEPVPLEMHVVPFAGFSYRQQLPDTYDDLDAARLAKELTRGREQMRVIVAVSRRLSFVYQGGELVNRIEAASGRSTAPVMKIGKSLVQFDATD